MSIKGFNVNGVTEQYDYNSLDNKPEIHNVPTGGTAGQVLAKTSGADYAVGWVNQTGGGGSEEELFHCTYGTTIYSDIQAAITSGKIPVAVWNDVTYYVYKTSGSAYLFFSYQATSNIMYWVRCDASGWTNGAYLLQERLRFDSSPTQGSQNPVTSGGIYNAIQEAGGGTDDYTDLTNKPQINGNTLEGNKTAANLGLVSSVNGQTGDVTVQAATDAQVTTAVNTWLGNNIAQETGYALDASLTMSNAAAPADKVGDLKSALQTTDDVIGVVNDFEGVNAVVSVNKNIVTATKGSASNWYAFGVKNKPLKFMLRGVEYMIVGYGISPSSANYVFFLAVVTNTSTNFGKGYVFSQNVHTKALATDHALTTQQIFNANAAYSANANIDYYFSGTEVTISYNGLSNTIDLSEIPVSTNLSGNFSVPMVGFICHPSVQGDSYSLEYDTALKTLDNFNQWDGKKWCAFGDSITAYGYYQPLVLSATGMGEYTNMGIGGSTIAELYDGQTAAFCNRYNTIADGFDIITILGGTNDFGKNIPLGQKGSTDKKTFYGGVSALLSGIKAKFPTTPILFFTPLQRDYFGTAEEISGMVNGNGNTLRQYRDIIIDLCTDAGAPCFDLFGMSGLYPENVHQWTLDGLHPNQTFWNTHYKVISDFILKYLPTT